MSITVYVVLEIVDLGDHIVSIHYSETIAESEAQRLNEEWRAKYPNNRQENYYVDSHIVQP